jgi:hypothetical protein
MIMKGEGVYAQADRQIDRQIDRHTHIQTDKQTDRQTDKHKGTRHKASLLSKVMVTYNGNLFSSHA